MDGRTDELMLWMNRWLDGWMAGWMDGWTVWMDQWMDGYNTAYIRTEWRTISIELTKVRLYETAHRGLEEGTHTQTHTHTHM